MSLNEQLHVTLFSVWMAIAALLGLGVKIATPVMVRLVSPAAKLHISAVDIYSCLLVGLNVCIFSEVF